MNIDRRTFLAAAGATILAGRDRGAAAADVPARKPFKAILFDAFALFDPRVVALLAERLYPGRGSILMQAWRTRQFEYQWLRVLGDRYVDFLRVTEESLTFAARQVGVTLTSESRMQLMHAYHRLEVCPDTLDVLPRIRGQGVSLGILSNMTSAALESGLAKANLRSLFSHVLSTDRVRSYKPAREAYELGVQSNRVGSAVEELGAAPRGTGSDLHSLFTFLEAGAS